MVREYGFNPRSKVSVEDGAMLPKKFEPFPEHMYGKPLEEIDNFIYEEVSPTNTMWLQLPHHSTEDSNNTISAKEKGQGRIPP